MHSYQLSSAVTPLPGRGVGGEVTCCPLNDGFGVYIARAALVGIEGLPKEQYINECELSPLPSGSDKGRPTGVSEFFSVYPNPTSEMLTFEFVLGAEDKGNVSVLDPTGKTLLTSALSNTMSIRNLDVSQLSEGLYLLHIRTDHGLSQSQIFSVIRY